MQINAGASNNNLYIASTDATSGISLSDNGGSINLATTSSGAFRVMTGGDASSAADNSAISMLIDANGHVTKPLQTCVSVRKTSTQSNMTNNETITFDTEDRDQNADYASNTFTAPIDGNYLITVNVAVTGPDGTATYNRIKVNTSNYNYSFGIKAKQDYDVAQGDPSYDNYGGSIVTHMDAGDTAVVKWSVSGGSDKADAFDSTFASFTLIC